MIAHAPRDGRAPVGRAAPSQARSELRRGYDARLDVLRTLTLEVTLCVIAGDSVPEIARFLQRSPSTVRRHIETAKGALGCANVAELRRRFRGPGPGAA
jgi:DNA-binding NarL/FixJ family response regulator